jgi:hypothetical protein
MSQLNLTQEAMLMWPVLALAARMQKVLTYGDVEGLTGIVAVGQGKPLGMINSYCKSKGYPQLNTIAVLGQGDGVGFPGRGEPGGLTNPQYLEERARVFAFDWTSKAVNKPRPEDFEAA